MLDESGVHKDTVTAVLTLPADHCLISQ